jgi:hypothetical protein
MSLITTGYEPCVGWRGSWQRATEAVLTWRVNGKAFLDLREDVVKELFSDYQGG